MRSDVTAIITHLCRVREPNLGVIVDSLRSGSMAPGEIMVWNNERRPLASFPFGPRAEADELWFSACCAAAAIPLWVVPCQRGASDLIDLPSYGVGLCRAPDYTGRRDATPREIAAGVGPACSVA